MSNIKQALESAIECFEQSARGYVPFEQALLQCKSALSEIWKCEPVVWKHFDEAYKKAVKSSEPDDWMNAALMAQQVRRKQLDISPQPQNVEKCEPVAKLGRWMIDKSTGTDILTLDNCSVIEGKYAHYIMGLLQKEIDKVVSELENTSPISKEAYDGAREDLAIWKKRALEAEKKVTLYDQRIVDVGVIAMTPIKSPQQREWVGLEHRDVMEAWKFAAKDRTSQTIPEKFAAAIDSKLKQLNKG